MISQTPESSLNIVFIEIMTNRFPNWWINNIDEQQTHILVESRLRGQVQVNQGFQILVIKEGEPLKDWYNFLLSYIWYSKVKIRKC